MSGTFAADIPDFTNKTIDSGRFRLVEAIGEGAMGVVYRAVEERSADSSSAGPKEFAVKILIKADADSIQGQCQTREIVMHQIASEHPSVLTLHKVIEENQYIFLIVDYCPGGDLFSAIVERFTYCQNDYLVKKIFIQILDAVQSIHKKGIYHRDLKPDNILINADGTEVFLGDFGLATDTARCEQFGCGSSYYMSPECIGEEHNHMPYSPLKSDTWALGIILTNMIAGRNPWRFATTDDANFRRYLSERDFLTNMLPISKSAQTLLRRVFTFNPYTRISIREFREEVLAIDTFFLTEKQLARASEHARIVAKQYKVAVPPPVTPVIKTPLMAKIVAQSALKPLFSEEGYIYPSPNPDLIQLVHKPVESQFTIGSVSTEEDMSSSSSESAGPLTPEATGNIEIPVSVASKKMEGVEDGAKEVVEVVVS